MKNYLDLSISELHELLLKKEVTPLELTKIALEKAKNDTNNAFEYIMEEEALEAAEKLSEPEEDNPLWGIPFVIKDNFSTKDVPTTASSNILNGYKPLFNATVVQKLLDMKCVPIAKTTLDELAMGGTGTSGHLGKTFNPFDPTKTRFVGGSSAGTTAAVCAGITPFGLGSDTGDSTRKPASFAGIVGFKPTWSVLSRFGLFPFVPSMDTVGIMTRNVKDVAIVMNATQGKDTNDSTCSLKENEDYGRLLNEPLKGKKVALIKEINDSLTNPEIVSAFNNSVNKLKELGAEVETISISKDLLISLFPTYYVISCAEATSNNANLDGIKFGPYQGGSSYEEVIRNARTKGFGEMIKRRFVIGSFSLMKENQEDLFVKAQRNRHKVVDTVNKIFEEFDTIFTPAAPDIAPKFDDKTDKLSDNYLIADNHLCIGNFGGFPSITLPIAIINEMPFGGNFTCKAFNDALVLNFANQLESVLPYKGLRAKGDQE